MGAAMYVEHTYLNISGSLFAISSNVNFAGFTIS